MKMLDLFSGTQSVSRIFRENGWETYTIEIDKRHKDIDWYSDIMNITAKDILDRFGRPDVIWASPPCDTYTIVAIHHHRKYEDGVIVPTSDKARMSDELIKHTLNLINELQPKFYFIENPVGCLRKMDFMKPLPRFTVTYCQYGLTRMKPTDIWTNMDDPKFIRPCKNGDPCHERAPRGTTNGTQKVVGSIIRSMVPPALSQHIVERCTEEITSST
jgi:site-specific DNA-cytosine methylase